jgi:hypothetical protein
MRKIKLQVEDLQVESFLTAEADTRTGTVRPYEAEVVIANSDVTCPPQNTCNQTHCGGYSCEWTKCAADTCKAADDEFVGYGV